MTKNLFPMSQVCVLGTKKKTIGTLFFSPLNEVASFIFYTGIGGKVACFLSFRLLDRCHC